jgi:hypothetical protein
MAPVSPWDGSRASYLGSLLAGAVVLSADVDSDTLVTERRDLEDVASRLCVGRQQTPAGADPNLVELLVGIVHGAS